MADESFNTLQLHDFVERWQAGDKAAVDSLLCSIGGRLEQMTRRMLRGFPLVRGGAETADVLQGTLLRLVNTLRRLQPESTRHFFNPAGVHIRRELLDLARSFSGKYRLRAGGRDDSGGAGVSQVADASADEDLDLWCRFHEAVDQLPVEEREVMGLVFYHGWTQVQIAGLLQVDERTVRRRWQSACLKLQRLVGGKLPTP